jgi:hypothetical protein
MIIFESSKRNNYPVIAGQKFLLHRLELRDFRGNPNFITLKIFSEQNLNSHIMQFRANDELLSPVPSVYRVSYAARTNSYVIPDGISKCIFAVFDDGIPIEKQQFTVYFELNTSRH